jgi:hypothetical protein
MTSSVARTRFGRVDTLPSLDSRARPHYSARCGASLRLSEFVPDEFVDCGGRMPERTSAQPTAQRARHSMCRVTRVGSHSVITIRKTKRPTWGRFALLAERVGFEPTEGLTLRRFSRPVPSTARPYLHELFAYARRDARATTPVLLRASCPSPLRGQRLRRCSLRLPACASRPGPSTARPSLRNLLLVAKRGCAVYQECCAGRPGLPFFDSASRQPKRIASGIIAPNSGSSSTGSRITIGASCVALA